MFSLPWFHSFLTLNKFSWIRFVWECSLTFEFMVLILIHNLSRYIWFLWCTKFHALMITSKTTKIGIQWTNMNSQCIGFQFIQGLALLFLIVFKLRLYQTLNRYNLKHIVDLVITKILNSTLFFYLV